jgi:hypothetical protein
MLIFKNSAASSIVSKSVRLLISVSISMHDRVITGMISFATDDGSRFNEIVLLADNAIQ